MPFVLFVCTANLFRSPLAAALLREQFSHEKEESEWRIESAGTWAEKGITAPRMTLDAAASLGLNGLEGHSARQVDQELLAGSDLVIVMESGHKESICIEFPAVCQRVYMLSEIADGLLYDIPDPAAPGVDPSEVGLILSDLIVRGREKILELAESLSRKP